ncbi:glycosyltransferase family 1 protein [Intestinibacter sp.]
MKYKILHIVGGMGKGGTETMLMNIYRKIDRKKIQFDFIYTTNEETYYDKEILELGGNVLRIDPLSIKNINKMIKQICDCIEKNGPYQAVHAHTLFNCGIAMLASKKSNVDIRVSHAHTTADNEVGLIRKMYISIMRKLILNNSTNLLACSDLAGEYLFGAKNIKNSKYSMFPNLISYENIIDIDDNKVEKFKEEYNLSNYLVIGHIGTFKESKNQKFLLEVTKVLKDKNTNIKLLLVGDGGMRDKLESKCKELDIEDRVIFTGIRDDVDVILNSIDVFAFPSTFEGLGLVLLEAQAAGLPCVVSEAIQPEADLKLGLFNNLNLADGAEIWADKIIEVAGKKEIDKKKILKAFDDNGYSNEKCISKLLSIYKIK